MVEVAVAWWRGEGRGGKGKTGLKLNFKQTVDNSDGKLIRNQSTTELKL